jgi:hypothetical protein
MGYDRKYGKVLTEFGNIGNDEPVVVFRAQDLTLPLVLENAWNIAKNMGSPERHIEILKNTQKAIMKWQQDNSEKIRIPNSESSKERLEN